MKYKHLELIGIHIKKTGGRSFKQLLENQYPGSYYRINITPKEKTRKEFIEEKLAAMPKNTKVIHGHFYYQDILPLVEENPDISIITWLRDPVQRIVSQYYFTMMKYETGQMRTDAKIHEKSLLDFAEMKSINEPMSKVLAGVDLKDLRFVGLLEFLDEDLAYLAKMMGWRKYKMPHINANTAFKAKYSPPTDEEVAQIKALCKADMDLYNYALELRKMRLVEHNQGSI